MLFKRFATTTLLSLSLVSCGGVESVSSLLDDSSPVVEEAQPKTSLVKFQNSFRSTQTFVKLERKDLDSFFQKAASSFAQYDLSDLEGPVNAAMNTFKFKSISLDADKNKSLISIDLEEAMSFEMPSGATLKITDDIAITSFGETDAGNMLFNLAGFTWNDVGVKALEWNDDEGVFLHLADGKTTPMSIDGFIEFYDEHEDAIAALIEKFEDVTVPSSTVILDGMMTVFDWFKTTYRANAIHIPVNHGSDWYKMLEEQIAKLAAFDKDLGYAASRLKQIHVSTGALTLDFTNCMTFSRGSNRMKLNKRIVISPRSRTSFNLKGVSATENGRRRWFNVFHGRTLNNGYIQFAISVPRILGGYRTMHKSLRIPGA